MAEEYVLMYQKYERAEDIAPGLTPTPRGKH
jgi:hypothetical protein